MNDSGLIYGCRWVPGREAQEQGFGIRYCEDIKKILSNIYFFAISEDKDIKQWTCSMFDSINDHLAVRNNELLNRVQCVEPSYSIMHEDAKKALFLTYVYNSNSISSICDFYLRDVKRYIERRDLYIKSHPGLNLMQNREFEYNALIKHKNRDAINNYALHLRGYLKALYESDGGWFDKRELAKAKAAYEADTAGGLVGTRVTLSGEQYEKTVEYNRNTPIQKNVRQVICLGKEIPGVVYDHVIKDLEKIDRNMEIRNMLNESSSSSGEETESKSRDEKWADDVIRRAEREMSTPRMNGSEYIFPNWRMNSSVLSDLRTLAGRSGRYYGYNNVQQASWILQEYERWVEEAGRYK